MDTLKIQNMTQISQKSCHRPVLGMLGKLGAVLIGLYCGLWYFQDNHLDSLKGKRVLVTGASTGIGEQLAYQFASLGCHVVVTSRRLEALKKVTKRCGELSPQNYSHHSVVGDMENMEDTKHVVEQAISLLGGLDILVLNHIISSTIEPYRGSVENISYFNKVTDVNFRSYVHLTSYALSQLIANEGRIIVVNSLLGKVHHPFLSAYSASKHALHGFFGSLRSQFVYLGQNVAVTVCTLGFIGTDNSLKEIRRSGSEFMLKAAAPACPESTARAIVSAGASRAYELHYPYGYVRIFVFLRGLFPETFDAFMRITCNIKQ